MAGTTHEELVAAATALIPLLREGAPEGERLRRLADESAAAIRDAGLARTLRPTPYGGYDMSYRAFAHVVRELARGDASAGWCGGTWLSQAMTVARYPKAAQDEVFGSRDEAFVISTGSMGGRMKPVEGGWLVSGRWGFASGVHHAQWISAGALTPEGTGRGILLPVDQVELLDVWDTVGLRGTGSTDYVAHEVFVPEHRSIEGAQWVWRGATERFVTGPLRNHGAGATQVSTSIFAPAAVGNALAFLDAFVAGAPDRTILYARVKQSDHVGTQQRLAESSIEADIAGMLLERCYDVLDRYEETGRIPVIERSQMRRDTAFAVNTAYRAVNRIFEVSGAHALSVRGELQRRWRDAHAIASQPNFHFDFEAETWGKLRMGLDHTHPSL
jgi:3-hydroxy-9,10-secoandrosta-1,3,5(10)-triene-9,17-dione monooxygenase